MLSNFYSILAILSSLYHIASFVKSREILEGYYGVILVVGVFEGTVYFVFTDNFLGGKQISLKDNWPFGIIFEGSFIYLLKLRAIQISIPGFIPNFSHLSS